MEIELMNEEQIREYLLTLKQAKKQEVLELKIKLNHTPYSSTNKDEFKIWWFGDLNQLVYHYLAPFGVHTNMTFTEYVVLPKSYTKKTCEYKLLKEDDEYYIVLNKIKKNETSNK